VYPVCKLLRKTERVLNSLGEGQISCYTTARGQDISRDVIVSGYVTFYQINKFFRKYRYFFVIDKMSSQAVVERPQVYETNILHLVHSITAIAPDFTNRCVFVVYF